MSDSDTHTPEQPASRSLIWRYLLAALVGTAAIIALYFFFRDEQTIKPVAITPPPKVQHSSELAKPVMKTASLPIEPEISEPVPAESEPVMVESKPEVDTSPPEPVDHAIIPADHSGPPWALNLISLSTRDHAMKHLAELAASGVNPEMVEVLIDGRHWYRIRIKGFTTIAAAKKAGERFVGNKEYRTLWVGGYR